MQTSQQHGEHPSSAQTHEILRALVLDLKDQVTGRTLDAECVRRGLPPSGSEESLTKAERLARVVEQVPASDHRRILHRFLEVGGLRSSQRNQVQDVLWIGPQYPEITVRARREVVTALDEVGREVTSWNADGLQGLLDELWDLDPLRDLELWTGSGPLTRVQEVASHPGGRLRELGDALGMWESNGHRFALFLQGVLSGRVVPDEEHLRSLGAVAGEALGRHRLQLTETDGADGYPAFIVWAASTRMPPAQLIVFASRGVKPDLRASSIMDRRFEVLTEQDQVLAYEHPVPEEGLTWTSLSTWWAQRQGLQVGSEAKNDLWSRMKASVDESGSPPASQVFAFFYRDLVARFDFALLPEVWVHWDPRSVRERGKHAFTSQRMDFLLLLPGGRRVVLEVDGQQHYAVDGRPDPSTYARTVQADRDLRLAGYEVYRFAGVELQRANALEVLTDFFTRLMD